MWRHLLSCFEAENNKSIQLSVGLHPGNDVLMVLAQRYISLYLLNFICHFIAKTTSYCKGRCTACCNYSLSWLPWITLYHWLLCEHTIHCHFECELINEYSLINMLNHIDPFRFPMVTSLHWENYQLFLISISCLFPSFYSSEKYSPVLTQITEASRILNSIEVLLLQ